MASRIADEIQFMIIGKPGIGKSTLANALVGEDIAKVGSPGSIHSQSVTRNVVAYMFSRNGVRALIWDTPGLMDSTLDQDTVLKDISTLYSSIDLFLLCIQRIIPGGENYKIIKCLESKFSKDIWKKTLVVLVRANCQVQALKTEQAMYKDTLSVASKFSDKMKDREVFIKKLLGKSFLGLVPTGHVAVPKLLETDKDSWLSKLWEKCLRSLSIPEKQAALQKLNEDRLTDNPSMLIKKESLAQH